MVHYHRASGGMHWTEFCRSAGRRNDPPSDTARRSKSTEVLAKRYGINEELVAKWKKVLGGRSAHQRSATDRAEHREEAIVVAARRHRCCRSTTTSTRSRRRSISRLVAPSLPATPRDQPVPMSLATRASKFKTCRKSAISASTPSADRRGQAPLPWRSDRTNKVTSLRTH